MLINPMVVVAGALLCLMPVALGLLVAHWHSPFVAGKSPRVGEMALADTQVYDGQLYRRDAAQAMIRGGPAMMPEEAWRQEAMRDEGDLYDVAHQAPLTYCPCPSCVERRHG